MTKSELSKYGRNAEAVDDPNNERGWRWFGTLTFAGSPSESHCRSIYWKWFREIERAEGRPNSVSFVCVIERGAFPGKFRFHVMFGGDHIGAKWDWMLCWVELGGDDAFLHSYRPFFHSYLLDAADDNSDFDISVAIGGCLWLL